MNKKPSLLTFRTRSLPVCKYLVIPALLVGFSASVLAQPSDTYTWNYSVSFSGTGALPVDQTSYSDGNIADDPTLTVNLTGNGTDVLSRSAGNLYLDSSTLSATATASISTSKTAGSFSVSQPYTSSQGNLVPNGSDPGLSLIGYGPQPPYPSPYPVTGSPLASPFYGLFPPPSGVDYDGTIAPTGVQDFFNYTNVVLNVGFGANNTDGSSGEVDLVLGNSPTLTSVAPDLSMPGYSYYTFSYADSQVYLSADIGEADPFAITTGNANITVLAAAPDSGPGLTGALTLLGLCAVAAWQKKARLA